MHEKIHEIIRNAEAKALATTGPAGLNVVPLSMVKVNDGSTIWLFNFFMDKTVKNLAAEPFVALTCWSALRGVQIKGDATYTTSGTDFDAAANWVASQNPKRVIKGLIALVPTEIYDISPGGAFSPEELQV